MPARLSSEQKRLVRLFFNASLAIHRRGEGLADITVTVRVLKSGMTDDEYLLAFDTYWRTHRRTYLAWYEAGLDSVHLHEVMWTWASTLELPDKDALH